MQAVTVGDIATEEAQKLFTAHQYSDYLYFHVGGDCGSASRIGTCPFAELGFAGEEWVIFGYSGSTVSWESVQFRIPLVRYSGSVQVAGVTGERSH